MPLWGPYHSALHACASSIRPINNLASTANLPIVDLLPAFREFSNSASRYKLKKNYKQSQKPFYVFPPEREIPETKEEGFKWTDYEHLACQPLGLARILDVIQVQARETRKLIWECNEELIDGPIGDGLEDIKRGVHFAKKLEDNHRRIVSTAMHEERIKLEQERRELALVKHQVQGVIQQYKLLEGTQKTITKSHEKHRMASAREKSQRRSKVKSTHKKGYKDTENSANCASKNNQGKRKKGTRIVP